MYSFELQPAAENILNTLENLCFRRKQEMNCFGQSAPFLGMLITSCD